MPYRRSERFITTAVGDELVMLDTATGDFVGLPASGVAVWEHLAEPRSKEELRDHLMDLFAVEPAQCEQELDAFLAEMEAMGAITSEQASAV